ncbi:hypothetical protein NKH18_45025 [Streptomyces sp. M10(2022)]
MRHFVEREVPDERGLLTLCWYDTFPPTTQSYSGPVFPVLGELGIPRPAADAGRPGLEGA